MVCGPRDKYLGSVGEYLVAARLPRANMDKTIISHDLRILDNVDIAIGIPERDCPALLMSIYPETYPNTADPCEILTNRLISHRKQGLNCILAQFFIS